MHRLVWERVKRGWNNLRLRLDLQRRRLAPYFCVVDGYKLLKLKVISTNLLKLVRCLRVHLADCRQHVLAHVFVPVQLEHFARQRLPFEVGGVDEVAKIAPNAALRPMKVLAGHSSVVGNLDLLFRELLLLLEPLLLLNLGLLVGLDQVRDLLVDLRHGLRVLEPQLDMVHGRQVSDVRLALLDQAVERSRNLVSLLYNRKSIKTGPRWCGSRTPAKRPRSPLNVL